ncbi:hypothetical protein EKO23_23735 [Nocardioides guangzhouensis]|uniref:AttH domain-containing protein n=1 Tax=Nocardioides guangzhouensis TaxID=2497878 RepID=A0A4Q4Z3D1_9ACTN|nr:hypothetical protein [Nocardioides guangzhouensis]RYP81354.1 hypothetical protein EKO23_23735 [Nocardioides guangzhouensis]
MRTRARFPDVDPAAGHYESFYLKASAPGGGEAVWIRHTVHQRPGAAPTASVWFVHFGAGQPRAAKVTVGADALSVPPGEYVDVGGCRIGQGWMTGKVAARGLDARWDLALTDRAPGLRHLPAGWMYDRGFPRTKVESPHPSVTVTGEVRLGDTVVALAGWDGIVGHNWGSEHAARWVWLQAPLADGGYLDVAAARVGVGPVTTPWIANGGLLLGDLRVPLGGPLRMRATSLDAATGRCTFALAGPGVRLYGTVVSPADRMVGWRYADPDGGEHQVSNCSVADLELIVQRRDAAPEVLHVPGAAAYELGTREPQPGVPMQPYPDG